MRTVVVGVAYPEVRPFLTDYLQSLDRQTDRDFELRLFNDGFVGLEDYIAPLGMSVSVSGVPGGLSPIQVKKFVMETLGRSAGVRHVIFTDADDYYHEDRVRLCKEHLGRCDFVVNEMSAVGADGSMLRPAIIRERAGRLEFADIVEKNFFGLSNSALNWECLSSIFPIPSDVCVTDWWIGASLMARDKKGAFIDRPLTLYRHHGSNTAGLCGRYDRKRILFGVRVKLAHYGHLAKFLEGPRRARIEEEHRKISELASLLADERNMDKYLERINASPRAFLWWEEIQLEIIR